MSEDGDRVRARRERLAVDKRRLALEAGVDRNTLSALESGAGFHGTTLTKVERVLDRLEAESGLGPPVPEPSGPPKAVVVRLKNDAGEVVVEGPGDGIVGARGCCCEDAPRDGSARKLISSYVWDSTH